MQDLPNDFQGLIGLWPSMGAFGRDLAGDKACGRIFHRRNRIPRKLWPKLLQLAQARGLAGVTPDYLERLYIAGRRQGR